MNGIKVRVIVNIFLLVGMFIALIIYAVLDEFNQSPQYELPKIQTVRAQKIVTHKGYTVNFNTVWKIPNWVAYELTTEEAQGQESRGNDFASDPDIWDSPNPDEYNNSGYDRGHMAPAGDMKWSKQVMQESFYTSNICPQNKNLNKGDWKDLEEHIRNLATKYDHIYITCGPIVSSNYKTIGQSYFNQIAIPDAFFKAILRQNNDQWSALGFLMPNKAGHKPLNKYAMSIDELEIITDMDFFYALPDSIEEKIESTYNLKDWDL